MGDSVNLGKSPDYHKSETFLLLQQKETMHLPHCLSRNFNCSFQMLMNLNVSQHINFFSAWVYLLHLVRNIFLIGFINIHLP